MRWLRVHYITRHKWSRWLRVAPTSAEPCPMMMTTMPCALQTAEPAPLSHGSTGSIALAYAEAQPAGRVKGNAWKIWLVCGDCFLIGGWRKDCYSGGAQCAR